MSALSIVVEDAVTALRRAVFAHGFQPIAIWNYDYVDPYVTTPGKQPLGRVWQATRGVQRLDERATNTGVLTRDLRAIDIDFDDDRANTVRAIAEECLGQTPLVRFRANSQRRLLVFRGFGRKINIDDAGGKHWVEVQGDGQQFVAFGRHPSGAELEWEDDNAPDCFAYADLPEVSEGSIDRFVAAVCEEFSFLHRAGQVMAAPPPAPAEIVPFTRPSSANAEAWAQTALEDEARKVASCAEGGRNSALNSAAYSLGQIVAGGYLSESDVVNALRNAAASCGLPRDKGGWPAVNRTIQSGLVSGKKEPRKKPDLEFDPIPVVYEEISAGMVAKAKLGTAPVAKTWSRRDPIGKLSFGAVADWTQPVGLIAEMADWILSTSRRPNRPLAVAAATSILSAVCGRHLYSATGTAMNLFIACIAETAVGKDRPFSAVAEILHAAGLGQIHTTAKSFSVGGFEEMLKERPCCVATVDEMGTNLLARMSHKNASSHEATIKSFLQELWSRVRGKSAFSTTRRAQSAPVEIVSPSLTIFGASTPEAFYEAMPAGSMADGFMNRFLIAPAAPRAPKSTTVNLYPVPHVIIDCLQGIVPALDGNLGGLLGVFSPHAKIDERQLEWETPEIGRAADAFEEEILRVIDRKPSGYALLGRTFEYTVRLAGLHAVSRAGALAKVGAADLEWGAAWALASAREMMAAAGQMARNDYEAKLNQIEAVIRESGTVKQMDLLRRLRNISARERDEMLKNLADQGVVEQLEIVTSGRKARAWRLKAEEAI